MTATPTTIRPWTSPQYGRCARCEADADLRQRLLENGHLARADATDLAGLGLSDCATCRQWERTRWAAIELRALRGQTPTVDVPPDWPALADEAYHGLAGEIVRAVEPHTEADPVAVLVQLLVGFGNLIGRTAYFTHEGQRHFLNLFAVLVGRTSKGRKGTSWGRVRQYLNLADPDWLATRVKGGLASGEGMVDAIRDPVEKQQPIKGKGGRVEGYQTVIEDHGEEDKRLLCVEEEYAAVLRMLERQGNSLSARIREAWDGRPLGSLTKNSRTRCAEPHVSIIGHVTDDELRRYLTATETANGFGNRHLWVMVRRSRILPDGGDHAPDADLGRRLQAAAAFARTGPDLRRDADARDTWHAVYGPLSDGKPGLAGMMLGRAEAQVCRLACLYAVLDLSPVVKADHLAAALALWDYCDASVRMIFGDATGDDVADTILRALRGDPDGLSRTDISALFGRNLPTSRIAAALEVLRSTGLATPDRQPTAGGPREQWKATK